MRHLPPVLVAPGDVSIWYRFTEAQGDHRFQTDLSQLSPDEIARCERFVFARDRCDFAAAHALLRRVLSMYDDVPAGEWRFVVDANGKPSIANQAGGPPLVFNLSHTHGLVACAVARDADLGVDVEGIERVSDGRDIAGRYFSQAERAQLEACAEGERATRFIELWTLKEAYVKAVGSGITHPLDTFAFSFEGTGALRLHVESDASPVRWTFALFAPSARHRLALAVRSDVLAPARIVARSADEEDALAPLRVTDR